MVFDHFFQRWKQTVWSFECAETVRVYPYRIRCTTCIEIGLCVHRTCVIVNRCCRYNRLPGQRESGKRFHYPDAQVPFPGVVRHRHVQRVTEHVLHLVAVQHAHPFAPQMWIRSLQQPMAIDMFFKISRQICRAQNWNVIPAKTLKLSV